MTVTQVPRLLPTIKLTTYGKEFTGDTPKLEFTEKATPKARTNNPMA
jgi:hypothetical protein